MPRDGTGGTIMTEENFKTVCFAISDLITEMFKIKKIYKKINNYTITQINEAIIKAREVQNKAQLFLTSDLYHLLTMGGLNAAQKAKIVKKTGVISATKIDVMSLARMEIIQIPKHGEIGEYKLHITPIVLKKER